jgi:hypothetical protein
MSSTDTESSKRHFDAKVSPSLTPPRDTVRIDGVGRRGTAGPLDISTFQALKRSSDTESGKRQFDAK